MSGGYTCGHASHRPQWRVLVRNANYSSFNGGHRTPSAYSALFCLTCKRRWRTKAEYVKDTPGMNPEERQKLRSEEEAAYNASD